MNGSWSPHLQMWESENFLIRCLFWVPNLKIWDSSRKNFMQLSYKLPCIAAQQSMKAVRSQALTGGFATSYYAQIAELVSA